MVYEIKKEPSFKNIWLRTQDAVASSDRKQFTFNDLALIQIRNNSILKVNSITLHGAGVGSASNYNWTIKMDNVDYKKNYYFNSDKSNIPTIATLNYDSKHSVQNGLMSLHLVNQDINQLTLQVEADDGDGLIKSSQNIEMEICLVICEYPEE